MIPRRVTFPFKNFTHDSSRAFAATSRSIYGGLSLNIKFVIYGEVCGFFCLLSRVSKKREPKSNDQQFLDKNLSHPERWRRVGAVAFYPFICVLLVPRRGGSFVLFPGRRSQAQWMLVKRFARGKNCLLIVKLIQSWTTHTHTETHTNSHTDAPKGWLRLSEWITVCVCVRFVCNGSEDEGC